MKELFSRLSDGSATYLYTITSGALSAVISDFGATLVKLFVPDKQGNLAGQVIMQDILVAGHLLRGQLFQKGGILVPGIGSHPVHQKMVQPVADNGVQ